MRYFFARVPREAHILDFGCAEGWVARWAKAGGWLDLCGLDIVGPADIVGDIRDWRVLGLEPASFDVIVAFEVVEHGDYAKPLRELLKPDGLLFVTTPVPRWDRLCLAMEAMRILQRRTGPHTNLVDLNEYPYFEPVEHRVRGLVSQWAVLRPV